MSEGSPKTILLLSANPFHTGRLRVDEEMREIKEGLRRAKQREQFVIESAEIDNFWITQYIHLENL